MLIPLLPVLRAAGVPVSSPSSLRLLEALEAPPDRMSAEDFYWVARAVLVKDERHFDRFERFAAHSGSGARTRALLTSGIPADWLRRFSNCGYPRRQGTHRLASALDALMDTLRKRLEEQRRPSGRQSLDRHRRHLAFRLTGYNRKACGSAARLRQSSRGQDLGPPRIRESRRLGRTRNAKRPDGAAAPARFARRALPTC